MGICWQYLPVPPLERKQCITLPLGCFAKLRHSDESRNPEVRQARIQSELASLTPLYSPLDINGEVCAKPPLMSKGHGCIIIAHRYHRCHQGSYLQIKFDDNSISMLV